MKTLRLAGSVAAILILYGSISDTPNPAPPDVQAEAPPAQPAAVQVEITPAKAPAAPVTAPKAKTVKSTGRWETRRYGLFGRRVRRVWVPHRAATIRSRTVYRSRG